jgi:ubiquinone/menaquinone biosynthesis C-methylase UbiE
MGRFATIAALYGHLRPPYPASFFCAVAEKLKLSGQQALIDLGTGPGLLALGFAPYVGRIVGVDPEPAMLAAAQQAAERASQSFTLIQGNAEDLPADIGRFDVVTIGRALHWMDRDATPALFERLVATDGAIAICSSSAVADGRNPWLDTYNEARRVWSEERFGPKQSRGERAHREPAAYLGNRFHLAETIKVETSHAISTSDLARRVLTFSSSSPQVLGDKTAAMLADVEARLAPLSQNGLLTEIVVSTAQLARR